MAEMPNRLRLGIVALLLQAALTSGCRGQSSLEPAASCDASLDPGTRCGTFRVPEDRRNPRGRQVSLSYVVFKATGAAPATDPIVFVAGGPGQTATEFSRGFVASPLRADRDIILLDQRGTSRSPRLDCRLPGSDAGPQAYLAPLFQVGTFHACRASLEKIADLTRYTTLDAVADLDAFREAMGYDRINLLGASYGTRVILQYLRQAPKHVRAAVMTSATPLAFRNPLFHARGAQEALDSVLAASSPSVAAKLDVIRKRLSSAPALATIVDPTTGKESKVTLSWDAFADALRVMMYSLNTAAGIPALLERAAAGDYAPFASQALSSNRALRSQLRLGLLMSVVCSEDVPRIAPDEIARNTAGTFLGDSRVRQQIAACATWPRASIPASYGQEVVSSIPSLVISGSRDPVTPPRWGELTVRGLSAGRHVIVEGGHSPGSPCLTEVVRAFFQSADAMSVKVACN